MADRYPLVVDQSNYRVEEIPSGDNLDLSGSSIVNAISVAATSVTATSVATTSLTATSIATTSLTVNTVDVTPIHEITNYYVTTAGNDTTGDGSASNPWATPHKALEFLRTRRISITDGYTRVTVNVGVGTYQFGVKTASVGSGYVDGIYNLVSSGSGTGAQIGVVTTTGGAIEVVKLLDPGTGYSDGETVSVSGPGQGSGATLTVLKVGSTEGNILGPIQADHIDGSQILITGETPSGTKPGSRGNHFYNQVGVGVGSDPAGTGPNYTWSAVYDSTSPAGAYPNPMVDGKGNTVASEVYNLTILQNYYQSELYFYGCDGVVASSPNAMSFDKFLFVGLNADGSNPKSAKSASLSGITNTPVVGVTTDTGLRWANRSNVLGGNIFLGENVSIHGFEYGIYMKGGGSISAKRLTVTNCGSIGAIIDKGSWGELPGLVSLNHKNHALYSYNGSVAAVPAILNNNGSIGILNYYNGWTIIGNTDIDPAFPSSVGYGNSTIVANNGRGINAEAGSVIRADGRYSDTLYVYGNSGSQIRATTGGIIEHQGANVVVEAAHGSSTTYSPAVNTIGNNNAIINTTL